MEEALIRNKLKTVALPISMFALPGEGDEGDEEAAEPVESSTGFSMANAGNIKGIAMGWKAAAAKAKEAADQAKSAPRPTSMFALPGEGDEGDEKAAEPVESSTGLSMANAGDIKGMAMGWKAAATKAKEAADQAKAAADHSKEALELAQSALSKTASKFEVGQNVDAWMPNGSWTLYNAEIRAVNDDGTYAVLYLCDGKRTRTTDLGPRLAFQ